MFTAVHYISTYPFCSKTNTQHIQANNINTNILTASRWLFRCSTIVLLSSTQNGAQAEVKFILQKAFTRRGCVGLVSNASEHTGESFAATDKSPGTRKLLSAAGGSQLHIINCSGGCCAKLIRSGFCLLPLLYALESYIKISKLFWLSGNEDWGTCARVLLLRLVEFCLILVKLHKYLSIA